MLRVTKVQYIDNYSLWLSFDDGTEGTIDLYTHLKGPVFQPLKDLKMFRQVSLNHELSTIVWPNGVDLAPEFLKNNLH